MESIQDLQKTARNTGLYVTISVLCVHNLLLGFCETYGALTIVYHKVQFTSKLFTPPLPRNILVTKQLKKIVFAAYL